MPELVQDRALEKTYAVPDVRANAGPPRIPVVGKIPMREQSESVICRGERAEVRLLGLDNKVPVMGARGLIDQTEGKAAIDRRRLDRSSRTEWPMPGAVRRKLKLIVPVSRDYTGEIISKRGPLVVRPSVEMEPAEFVVQYAVAPAPRAQDIKVRSRFAPYEKETELKH